MTTTEIIPEVKPENVHFLHQKNCEHKPDIYRCIDNAYEYRKFPTLDHKKIHADQMEASVLKAYEEPAVAVLVAKLKEMHRRAQKAEGSWRESCNTQMQLFYENCDLTNYIKASSDLSEKSAKELMYEIGVLRGRLFQKEESGNVSVAAILVRAVLNTALVSIAAFFILLMAWKALLL